MDANALLDLTLTDAAGLVRSRDVSPVQLVDACLERIETVDHDLRAYISVYASRAREVARAAELMIAADHLLGPLHGVPIALKDNIGLAGLTTTAGSAILAGWTPTRDATTAARLKSAGAIVIGKANMHEFAAGGTSANPHYGVARNPWNRDRSPAGSSGGSGVAVAARMCYGALGTDTGGSVRLPAAVNGIVGLRPTSGRVSNHGVIPLAWSMDTVGPMARTVGDCALLFDVIAGYDPRDAGSVAVPAAESCASLDQGVRGLRIGVIAGFSFAHAQAEVCDAVATALATLTELGAIELEVEIAHLEGHSSALLTAESCETSAYHQAWLRQQPESYGEDVRLLLEVGELYPATHYLQAQRYRTLLRAELLDVFRSVDVLISPTLPFTATPVGAPKVAIEGGTEEDMLAAIMQYTGLASLAGLPALSVPCGFDHDGMPIGMQLIGAPFAESTLFRLGAAFQAVTRFHTQAPPVSAA